MKVTPTTIYIHDDGSICIYLNSENIQTRIRCNGIEPFHNGGEYPCLCLIGKAKREDKL